MPKMQSEFTSAELEAYLDEALPVERMTAIEEALRKNAALQEQLAATNGRRDAGVHSVGEIWRRHRLSCPPREQLGSFLLGVLPADAADYMKFHLEIVECRYCVASLEDLRAQQSAADAGQIQQRRQRYYQSSAGYLRRNE
jgi:hypothetical protein